MRSLASRQFMLFLLVGGTAAAAQWLSRFGFGEIMPFPAAVACAFAVGLIVAFLLNRRFVFPAAGPDLHQQFLRFAAVNALAFVAVWVITMVLGDNLLPRYMNEAQAHAVGHGIGIMSPVVLSYVLHKRFTFKEGDAG
jgi:putative flippase GtrA